jgi:8-oxo-dGTP diphosphatase
VGGHLDPGEDYEAGAYRELEEETGVRLPAGRLRMFGEFSVFHEHSRTLDPFRVFVARTDLTDAVIECHEGRQIVFVDPGRIRRGELDLTEAAKIALPLFLASEDYASMSP